MVGYMIDAGKGNIQAGQNAQRIWRKLSGTAVPAYINKRRMSPRQIKVSLGGPGK